MIGIAGGDGRGLIGDESGNPVALAVLDVTGSRAADDPGVFRPAALARVDDELALGKGDAGEAAGQHPDVLPVVDREGTEVGVARTHPVLDERRDRREHDDRLGDPAARVGEQAVAELLEFGG